MRMSGRACVRACLAVLSLALLLLGLAALPLKVSAQDPDTTLSAITLDGRAIPDFSADDTFYEVGVSPTTNRTTLLATPTDSSASVAYNQPDGDADMAGHQITLPSDNHQHVTITVTNGEASQGYTLRINRGRGGAKRWLAEKDIYGLTDAITSGGKFAGGLHSDGTTLWVVNRAGNNGRVYAFDLATGARRADDDIDLTSLTHTISGDSIKSNAAQDVTGAGGTIWVSNSNGWILGYTKNDSDEWEADDDQGHRCAPTDTRGVALIHDLLYVTHKGTGDRLNALTFPVDCGEATQRTYEAWSYDFRGTTFRGRNYTGAWTDGVYLWVSQNNPAAILAYDLNDVDAGSVSALSFTSDDLRVKGTGIEPYGIWSDGETMWVADKSENIYSFAMPQYTDGKADLGLVWVTEDGEEELAPVVDFSGTTQLVGVSNDGSLTRTIRVRPRHPSATASPSTGDIDFGQRLEPGDPGVTKRDQWTEDPDTFTTTVTNGAVSKTYTLSIGRRPGLVYIRSLEAEGLNFEGQMFLRPEGLSSAHNLIGTTSRDQWEVRYTARSAEDEMSGDAWDPLWYPATYIPVESGSDFNIVSGRHGLVHEYDTYFWVQARARNSYGAGPWSSNCPPCADDRVLLSEPTPDPATTVTIRLSAPTERIQGGLNPVTLEGATLTLTINRRATEGREDAFDNTEPLKVKVRLSGTHVDAIHSRNAYYTIPADSNQLEVTFSNRSDDSFGGLTHRGNTATLLAPDDQTGEYIVSTSSPSGVNVWEDDPPLTDLFVSSDKRYISEGESATITLMFRTRDYSDIQGQGMHTGFFNLVVPDSDEFDFVLKNDANSEIDLDRVGSNGRHFGDRRFEDTGIFHYIKIFTGTMTAKTDMVEETTIQDFTFSVTKGTDASSRVTIVGSPIQVGIVPPPVEGAPTLGITRASPSSGTLDEPADEATEDITFTLTLSETSEDDITAMIAVSETGDALSSGDETTHSVTIDAGDTTAELTISVVGDTDWEPHSTITATVLNQTTYNLSTTAPSTSVTVNDDDFPDSSITLTPTVNSIAESDDGSSVHEHWVMTLLTDGDTRPHALPGAIQWTYASPMSTGGPGGHNAAPGVDVSSWSTTGVLSSSDLSLDTTLDRFIPRVDIDPDPEVEDWRYRYVVRRSVYVHDDDEPEAEDTVTVTLSAVPDHATDPTSPNIRFPQPCAEDDTDCDPTAPTAQATIVLLASDLQEVSIASVGTGDADEGDDLQFTVTRDFATSEALTVQLNVSEAGGDFVAAANEGDKTVVIPANMANVTYTVSTAADDDAWDAHSTVTVDVRSADTYTEPAGGASASRRIVDDDYPAGTLTMSVASAEIAEDTTATDNRKLTVTHTFVTTGDEQPHENTGGIPVLLSFASPLTAEAGDVGAISVTIDPDTNIERVNLGTAVDPNNVYRSINTHQIEIIDDDDEESAETLQITYDTANSALDENITTAGSPLTITIAASDESDASEDATLSALTLSAGTLSPTFAGATTSYTATVANSVSQITVTPTVNDTGKATFTFLNASDQALSDASTTTAGHQVSLSEGENIFKVKVTAEDTRVTETYTVTVTRSALVSISATSGAAEEGDDIVFTVTRGAATSAALTVSLAVSESSGSDVVTDGSSSVTIAANQTSAELTLSTTNDTTWEPHSTVTVTVNAGTAYSVSSTAGNATKTVNDDDFPAAEATISVDKPLPNEGDTVTITVLVLTDGDHQPHRGMGTLVMVPNFDVDSAVLADTTIDFTTLPLTADASDFSRTNSGDTTTPDWRYQKTFTRTFQIVNDTVAEPSEEFGLAFTDKSIPAPNLRYGTSDVLVAIQGSDQADAELSNLELNANGNTVGHLSPDFAEATTTYTAGVGNAVNQLTVTPTTGDSNATMAITPGDANSTAAGHQVNLSVGDTTIMVVVTAQNGTTRETYTVTVTRAAADGSMTPATHGATTIIGSQATYDISFSGSWTTDVTPAEVPSGARFSPLVGGVHSGVSGSSLTLLTAGQAASAAVQAVAEAGTTSTLAALVETAAEAATPTALEAIEDDAYPVANATTAAQVTTLEDVQFTQDFQLLTLLSSIHPSHDWFVGVSGLRLTHTSRRWLPALEVDLYPWDAGTEDGDDFSRTPNTDTDPQGTITSLRGMGPFTIAPIVTLELELTGVQLELVQNEGTTLSLSLAHPVYSENTRGTLSYALAGDDAGSFQISGSSLRLASGASLDHEDTDEYNFIINITDAGPNPDEVTPVAVTLTVGNVAETGTLTVTPANPSVGLKLTARIADPDGDIKNQSWKWQSRATTADDWADISGATNDNYTPVEDDEGDQLRVTVTYDDGAAEDVTLTNSLGTVAEMANLDDDNDLTALTLSDVTFTFASATTSYTASVAYTVARTTIAATAASTATVAYLDGNNSDAAYSDADEDTGGFQIALAIGSNPIKVQVTAQDGTVQTYTVAVTRAKPTVTITPGAALTSDSGTASFTITRSAAAADTLAVPVRVAQLSGSTFVADAIRGDRTFTIPAGQASGQLDVPITADDIWEPDGFVGVRLLPATHLTLGSANNAQVNVSDDDFPVAEVALTAESSSIDENAENAAFEVTVTATTARFEAPHEGSGNMVLSTRNGTASSSDYTALTATTGTFSFASGDFSQVDVDDDEDVVDHRYVATKTFSIPITADDITENDETIFVHLDKVTTGSSPTDSQVTVPDDLSLTLTIPANDASDDSTLSALSISPGTLSPATFDADTTAYSSTLTFGQYDVTINATANHSGARISYLDSSETAIADRSSTTAGHQVRLTVGETAITVRVKAENGDTTDYVLTLTRSKPVISVGSANPPPNEGDSHEFLIERDARAPETTLVSYSVSESGDMLDDDDHEGDYTVTIPANSRGVTVAVNSDDDDDVWEEHSDVTVAIKTSTAYTINTDQGQSVKTFRDNEFSAAVASLLVSSTVAEETGAKATATVTILTKESQQPHASSGPLLLSTVLRTGDDAAEQADFTALTASSGRVSFAAGDFSEFDHDDDDATDPLWTASKTVDIPIVDDLLKERAERFDVRLAKVTTGTSQTQSVIELDTVTTRTVTISQSDRSSDASLSAITLSQGAVSPAFTSGTLTYTASVDFENEQITVTPTRGNEFAMITFLQPDGADAGTDPDALDDEDPDVDGFQVDLGVNVGKVVIIRVEAEDEETTRDYQVTITRSAPTLTLSVKAGDLTEGDRIEYTVERNGTDAETTVVKVSLSEAGGDMVASTDEWSGETQVIQAGATSHSFSVATVDDEVWDATSTVTLSLDADSGYNFTAAGGLVEKQVADDDFPASDVALNVNPTTLDEGAPVVATVTIMTKNDHEPNEDAGSVTLSSSDGPDPDGDGNGAPATAGSDYTAISAAAGALTFAQGDFVRTDLDTDTTDEVHDWRYVASKQHTITTRDDTADEFEERFTVTLTRVSTGDTPLDSQIEGLTTPLTQAVDFARSDLSTDPTLVGLTLSAGSLDSNFVSSDTSYDVTVPFSAPQITITPSPGKSTFVWHDEDEEVLDDANTSLAGFQMDLPQDEETEVKISVTSQDGNMTQYYTLAITRQDPLVSISGPIVTEYTEGASVDFTLSLDGPVEDEDGLSVMVTLGYTVAGGDMLTNDGENTVSFATGEDTATITATTENDEAWEQHAQINAVLEAGSGYRVSGTAADQVTIDMLDDDFPAANATVNVAPTPLEEGAVLTATVEVRTTSDEAPHEGGGSILVGTTAGTATADADFTAPTETTGLVTFDLDDFVCEDQDDDLNVEDCRYVAVKTVPVQIIDDTEEETAEDFTVSLASVAHSETPTDTNITVNTTTQDVEISANDKHSANGIQVTAGPATLAATVDILNPSGATFLLVLRYAQANPNPNWDFQQRFERLTTGTEEVFTSDQLNDVPPLTQTIQADRSYAIEAWIEETELDANGDPVSTGDRRNDLNSVRATALGFEPAVARIDIERAGQTDATLTVRLANAATFEGRTIRMRYRLVVEGQADDADWQPALENLTFSDQGTFDLTGLRSGSVYQVQATLADDFTSGVQEQRFTTAPPDVVSVAADPATITHTSAVVVVSVRAPNGAPIHLRYRGPEDDDWITQEGIEVAEAAASASFTLENLQAGTPYSVQASYDSTFGDFDALGCRQFITNSAEDDDDGRELGGVCSRSGTLSSLPGGGGGGGGGGAPAVVLPSDEEFDWNVTRDVERLDGGNETPTGLWSDGHRLWVVENSASGADSIYVYDLSEGDNEDAEDGQTSTRVELHRTNRFSHGIWSNGETVWVSDSGQDRLFAYNVEDGEREESLEIELADDNRDPRGIWSDSELIYVLDSGSDAVFVYNLATGELVAQYSLNSLNGSPRGIWSDGITIWISDDAAKRLFAYRIAERDGNLVLVRSESEEFSFRSLLKGGNSNARGIWSDGEVMYVADEQKDRIFTYNMPNATDASLSSLTLSDFELSDFHPTLSRYLVGLTDAPEQTTVSATAAQDGAVVSITPADLDGDESNGHQAAVAEGGQIGITVTAPDGLRQRFYTVSFGEPATSCLNGLGAEGLSQVSFAGGSIEELAACAEATEIRAVFYWTGTRWYLYAPGGPEFLNRAFMAQFSNGLPEGAELYVRPAEPDDSG